MLADVLADAMTKNNNIKGVIVDGHEIKISIYADDTTLIIDGSRSSFQNSLQILELFSAILVLRLNYKKKEKCFRLAQRREAKKNCALKII